MIADLDPDVLSQFKLRTALYDQAFTATCNCVVIWFVSPCTLVGRCQLAYKISKDFNLSSPITEILSVFREVPTDCHLVQWLRMYGVIPLLLPHALMTLTGISLYFYN
jgi:hypothetical protein